MVARLELQTQNINEAGEPVITTSVLTEIDRNNGGDYNTPLGNVRVDYIPRIPTLGVIIDCSQAPYLQGSRSVEQRRLVVGKKGESSQQISPTETLVVNLDKKIHVTSRVMERDLGKGPSMGDVGRERLERKVVHNW